MHDLQLTFVLKCVSALNPNSSNFLCPDTVIGLVKLYPTSGIGADIIYAHLASAKSIFQSSGKNEKLLTIHELRTCLSRLPHAFSKIKSYRSCPDIVSDIS
jgi:hypothetical protein